MCGLLGRGGGSHGNIVLGPRALNGEGFGSKPKKKYISTRVCHECVCACVWLWTCGCVHVAACMHVYVHVRVYVLVCICVRTVGF